MTHKRRNKLPILVEGTLIDDILDLSDDQLLRESQDEFDDVEFEISSARNAINSAILTSELTDDDWNIINNSEMPQKAKNLDYLHQNEVMSFDNDRMLSALKDKKIRPTKILKGEELREFILRRE